jgi:DNA-binding MarR family transcriptional regulator
MSKYYFEIGTYLLKVMRKVLTTDHDKIEVKADREGFSIRESFFIVELGGYDHLTFGQLEQQLEIDRKTTISLITRLQKRKVIDKNPSENDKRQQLISLTEKGERVRTELIEYAEQLVGFSLNGLTINEEKAVLKFLSKLLQTTVTAPTLESIHQKDKGILAKNK